MASYKFRIFLYGALLLALLSGQSVFAQGGNDFPGAPAFPTYPPGGTVGFPPNSGAWQWGGTKGPVQQVDARKGDTIVFDVVGNCSGCYWRFAYPLHASPIITSGTDMQLVDPYNDGPNWIHWLSNGDWVTFCVGRCRFSVVAGDDYPWLRLGYDGNSDWYNQIEVQYVIPAPQSFFSVLSDPDKNTAQGFANFLYGFSGVMAGFSLAIPDTSAKIVSGVVAYGSSLFGSHYQNIARDPWDGDYCSPTGFAYNWQTIDDIDWARDADSAAYAWTVASIELIDGYGIQAYQAANRAMSAASVGDMNCAWARRSEAIGAINQMGGWMWYFKLAVEVNANVYNSDEMRQSLDALTNIMNWSSGVQ